MKDQADGYTVVELIVATLIFSVVMSIISASFSRIVRSSSQLVKAAETDIGGLIGLELLRCDLELAGFGLPWSVPDASYSEAGHGVLIKGCQDGCPAADPYLFNDIPPVEAPRAYRVGNNAGYNGSDYLVLKGSAIGMNSVSRSWSYLNYSSGGVVVKPSRGEGELKPGSGDRVIVVKSGVTAGSATKELLVEPSGKSFTLKFNEPLPKEFVPRDRGDSYLVYGVAPDDSGHPLNFPFNRADYYISRGESVSSVCAPHTGVLYKTTLNHGGSHTYYPILDCAADLQVVQYLDTNGDGKVDYKTEVLDEVVLSAEVQREQLREIRIYILAQQGKIDRSYSYPVADQERAIVVGDATWEPSLGVTFGRVWSAADLLAAFGKEWRNYRWKVYTVVVQPKNL